MGSKSRCLRAQQAKRRSVFEDTSRHVILRCTRKALALLGIAYAWSGPHRSVVAMSDYETSPRRSSTLGAQQSFSWAWSSSRVGIRQLDALSTSTDGLLKAGRRPRRERSRSTPSPRRKSLALMAICGSGSSSAGDRPSREAVEGQPGISWCPTKCQSHARTSTAAYGAERALFAGPLPVFVVCYRAGRSRYDQPQAVSVVSEDIREALNAAATNSDSVE